MNTRIKTNEEFGSLVEQYSLLDISSYNFVEMPPQKNPYKKLSKLTDLNIVGGRQ
jgi:hypothetical protein